MAEIATTILRYLDEIGGVGSAVAADPAAAKSLPVFMGRIYEPYRGSIFGCDYVLLVCGARDHPTPGQVEKHAGIARSAFGPNVAFVFPSLPAFDRKRLIQRRIPFVVPGRQIYLPMVMVDLREKAKASSALGIEHREALTAPAQALLLFHLQRSADSEIWKLNQWAEVLGYTRMTISRAFREMVAAGLCTPRGKGRSLVMQFPPGRRALWEEALPYLRSPVAGQFHVRIASRDDVPLYQAGVPALAQLTMIAAGREEVFAMSSRAYRTAVEQGKLVRVPHDEEDTAVVERWRYDPAIFASEGQAVDRLSLYLSLQHDHDERVQAALKELLEAQPW